MTKYSTQFNNTRQLNRIAGQIEGIKKMIEENRSCEEILIQLRSVRSAVKSVEAYILETYLSHQINNLFSSDIPQEQVLQTIKKAFLQYDK